MRMTEELQLRCLKAFNDHCNDQNLLTEYAFLQAIEDVLLNTGRLVDDNEGFISYEGPCCSLCGSILCNGQCFK